MKISAIFKLGTIITREKGKGGGSYNLTTGVIKHPPAGSGKKAPKVKTKTEIKRTPKK